MREIGGYLELEKFSGNEYYGNALALNTARNAFLYLVKKKNISKVYLPYYLCDSLYKACERESIEYEFYNIGEDFSPVFNKSLQENEFIYIVNFFGQFDEEKIKQFKEEYKNIVLDNVQAFFTPPVKEIDTIYSCRKFFGVPDGAYLISDISLDELEEDCSKDRLAHLTGRLEKGSASSFYEDFQANEKNFENLKVKKMSKITHNILGAIDYREVIKRRNENWDILDKELSDRNMLKIKKPNGPYVYPYYCEDGEEMRKELISKRIYVPTLWPNVLDFEDCELEKNYTQNLLPLPIDQRYNKEDMERIISCILNNS